MKHVPATQQANQLHLPLFGVRHGIYGWLFAAVFFLGGCGTDSSSSEAFKTQSVPLSALQLKQSTDCEDLKAYIKKSLIKRYTTLPRYQYCATPNASTGGGSAGGGGPLPPVAGDAPTDASAPKNASPDGVSDTNNQEVGVNEGDMVKNDEAGNVYILSGRHLIIAKGFPPQKLNTLKEIDLGARGLELFLDQSTNRANKRLVVIAREETPYYITDPVPLATDGIAAPVRAADYSIAIFLDVTDPANPAVLDQIHFKGYYREGRRLDGRLHLVSNYYIQLNSLYSDSEFLALQTQYWNAVNDAACAETGNGGSGGADLANDPDVQKAQAAISTKISTFIDTINAQDLLPDAQRFNNDTKEMEPIPYLSCQDIHHPDVDMNLGMQVVASIDTNGANLSATGIVNNAWITYVSADNLYLADTSSSWWWTSESNQPPTSQTAIYKFAISAKGKPAYVAAGRVDGYAKDQFSFSEFQGALRVATTQNDSMLNHDDAGNPIWSRNINNHLFVLKDNNAGRLNTVGAVRDFQADETIRSTRFFGNKGFVVTFRNIDPLFAFDLAEPSNPKLMGELTLPGFATYIHGYDDNHIITIGRAGNADGTGVGSGMQLRLIDISDIANPVVLDSYTPTTAAGWSWSDAEYDHKAFTFYKPANLLAIPMMVSPDYGSNIFNGIAAFNVSVESGIQELVWIDHSDLAKEYYCGTAPMAKLSEGFVPYCDDGGYVQWATPRRSVVMTEANNVYLYTISDIGMKVSETSDLSKDTIGTILFPPQPYPWWHFGPIGIVTSDSVGVPSVGAFGGPSTGTTVQF